MHLQRYVSRQMRAVLVDWLVDVHYKFKLNPESLFLGIWILDKFLSKQEVERKNLQLVCPHLHLLLLHTRSHLHADSVKVPMHEGTRR